MSALDILSSVTNDIKRHSYGVADYVDSHLEKVSSTLREALSSSQWIPESARPRPLPPPPRTFRETMASSTAGTLTTQIRQWIFDNKILTTAIVIAIGGVTYHVMKRKSKYRKKRRAKRAGNGARLEVVVVAGSPAEAVTRSVVQDLERRGFIVYVVCNTIEEELLVQNESRPDIKPLMIDIVDPSSARTSIDRFTAYLQTPHAAFQGAKQHHLTFRSLVLIPSSTYPSSPIAALPASTISDLLNTRLLKPILTLQCFLPLLQILPLSHPHAHPSSTHPLSPKPSIILLTPSIISSLSPAFHAPEALINSALTSLSTVLTAELSPLNIPVTHLQLGTFDTSAFTPHSRNTSSPSAQRADTLKWDISTRLSYAKNFVAMTSTPNESKSALGKGTPLRELNNAVFDAIVRESGGVVRVGMGSELYRFVGRWISSGLVAWMMGARGVDGGMEGQFGVGLIMARPGSSEGSESDRGPVSPVSIFPAGGSGIGDSEYISVHGERDEGDEDGI